MTNLRVADVLGHLRDDCAALTEHRVADELGMTRERPDRDPITVLAHVAQVVEPSDVDEHRGAYKAKTQHRNERLSAGEDLRVLAAQQLDRLVEGPRPLVLEPGGNHACAFAAASTALTMLWYPVQRQRLPSRPTRISSSDGLGCSFSSEIAAMTKPGVQ